MVTLKSLGKEARALTVGEIALLHKWILNMPLQQNIAFCSWWKEHYLGATITNYYASRKIRLVMLTHPDSWSKPGCSLTFGSTRQWELDKASMASLFMMDKDNSITDSFPVLPENGVNGRCEYNILKGLITCYGKFE